MSTLASLTSTSSPASPPTASPGAPGGAPAASAPPASYCYFTMGADQFHTSHETITSATTRVEAARTEYDAAVLELTNAETKTGIYQKINIVIGGSAFVTYIGLLFAGVIAVAPWVAILLALVALCSACVTGHLRTPATDAKLNVSVAEHNMKNAQCRLTRAEAARWDCVTAVQAPAWSALRDSFRLRFQSATEAVNNNSVEL